MVRYATTLRIMLSNLRKKIGLQPGMMNPPPSMPPQFADNDMVSSSFQNPAMVPFSMSDSGFSDKRINNPAAIPLWIQEQVGFRNFYHEGPGSTFISSGSYGYWFPSQRL